MNKKGHKLIILSFTISLEYKVVGRSVGVKSQVAINGEGTGPRSSPCTSADEVGARRARHITERIQPRRRNYKGTKVKQGRGIDYPNVFLMIGC